MSLDGPVGFAVAVTLGCGLLVVVVGAVHFGCVAVGRAVTVGFAEGAALAVAVSVAVAVDVGSVAVVAAVVTVGAVGLVTVAVG